MAPNALSKIKDRLDPYIGEKIRFKANKGRRRFVEREGVLEGTYPSLFTVQVDGKNRPSRRMSFTYADVLTQAVELVILGKDGDRKIECDVQ